MSRRSTPERLHAARREATKQRLIGEGGTPDQAERLIAQWELQVAQDGLERDGTGEAGWAWMLALLRS